MLLRIGAPTIDRPARAKDSSVMKGSPITAEEFERMLDKVPGIVVDVATPSWQRLLTGLWWSGLWLGEALDLWWDRPHRMCVDLSGRRPMLRVHAAQEKGNTDRLLPIARSSPSSFCSPPRRNDGGSCFRSLA
jgi:hypothetical protein